MAASNSGPEPRSRAGRAVPPWLRGSVALWPSIWFAAVWPTQVDREVGAANVRAANAGAANVGAANESRTSRRIADADIARSAREVLRDP